MSKLQIIETGVTFWEKVKKKTHNGPNFVFTEYLVTEKQNTIKIISKSYSNNNVIKIFFWERNKDIPLRT